jgi:5-methylcytosine-specific restriction endonuclease McrA
MFAGIRSFLAWMLDDAPKSAISLTYGVPRSGKWPALEREILRNSPNCVVCGEKAQCVHHIIPVHIDPKRELDSDNLAAVCEVCHSYVGHLKAHFKSYNKDFRKDAKVWWLKINNRP